MIYLSDISVEAMSGNMIIVSRSFTESSGLLPDEHPCPS